MITKSLAGIAAGVLLVGGGVMATAQAASTTTTTTSTQMASARQSTSAPVRTALRCKGYPASVFTQTVVRVKSPVRRGHAYAARVSVSARATKTTPRGTVTVRAAGSSRTARLVGGVAVVRMPKIMKVGRYTARATYHETQCSQWKPSSDTAGVRVVR